MQVLVTIAQNTKANRRRAKKAAWRVETDSYAVGQIRGQLRRHAQDGERYAILFFPPDAARKCVRDCITELCAPGKQLIVSNSSAERWELTFQKQGQAWMLIGVESGQ